MDDADGRKVLAHRVPASRIVATLDVLTTAVDREILPRAAARELYGAMLDEGYRGPNWPG
jgi:hypothetical protein